MGLDHDLAASTRLARQETNESKGLGVSTGAKQAETVESIASCAFSVNGCHGSLETTIKETMDFVRRVEEIEDEQARQMVLEEHNKLQDADERKPKISIEYPYKSGKYEINYYAVAQLKQLYDCMISANELTDNTKLYLNGEEKPNCKEYIRNMLIDYVKSDDKIIFAFDE